MKVWIEQDIETGLWFEVEQGSESGLPPVEIPDAIMKEWRSLNTRLDEIGDYFHKKTAGIEMTTVLHLCSNCAEIIKVCKHESDEEVDQCEAQGGSFCSVCGDYPQRILKLTAKLAEFGHH